MKAPWGFPQGEAEYVALVRAQQGEPSLEVNLTTPAESPCFTRTFLFFSAKIQEIILRQLLATIGT